MKKIYAFCLLLTLLVFTGNRASAITTTYQWDIPGSVMIKSGSPSSEFLELGADQTTYVFNEGDPGYLYFYAADGYTLLGAASTDGEDTYSVATYFNPPCINIFNAAYLDGKTIKVNCIKTERNDTFTINVENGLDFISAKFESGYELDLKAGDNTYNYNPQLDGKLNLTLKDVSSAYSVTLNGEPVTKNSYRAEYPINVTPGARIAIKVFESEADIPVDCTLNLEYASGMEACIASIRNVTASKYYWPADFASNTLVLKSGNTITVNFQTEDYTYSKVLLNGTELHIETSSFNGSKSVTFDMPKQSVVTLKIEGSAKVYQNISFTGYISGYEGINFSTAYYGGDDIPLPEGEALTETITIGSYQLTAENAKKFVIPVSEKIGKIFFEPKAGYYIAELYSSVNGRTLEQHSGSASILPTSDGTYFYMVVKKLEPQYSFTVKTTGSTLRGKLTTANSALTDAWNNPDGLSRNLYSGTSTINFYPGYSVPAVIAVSGTTPSNSSLYLDGAPVTGATNTDSNTFDYTFTPYSPVEGDGIPAGTKSDVQLYLSTAKPTMSGASLELEDGVEAEFFYSPIRHVADPAGQSVISGTMMIVKPASPNAVVTYKDEVVELDENGEFVFNATGNARNNVVKVSLPQQYVEFGVNPADGATVKTLNTITLTLPSIDETFETMLNPDPEVLDQVVVKNSSDEVVSQVEIGEPGGDDEGNITLPLHLTSAVTEAGTYTIVIPEKAFIATKFDEASESWVAVSGGAVTAAYNGTVTVDPDMVSICDDVTLTPASGETVEEIAVVKVTFNKISGEDYFSGWEFPNATFTNGETTVQAIVNYDWMSESETRVMTVTPVDEAEEPAAITAAGTWTLTIEAGTFTYNGESNGTITAEYIIEEKAPAYTLSPADGAVVDNLNTITIEFPAATTVEYNDTPITLVGAEYNASSTDVGGTGNSRVVSFRNPTVDGKYTVTFPAGAFTLDGAASEEVTATYTFQKAYVLNPESGSTLEEFEVAISFPNATNVEYVGAAASIVLTNGSSYASPSVSCVKDASASVPTFLMTLPESAQQPPVGDYSLIIDEGAFIIDGKASVEISAQYTIEHEVGAEYMLDPDGTIVYSEWGIMCTIIFDETATVSVVDPSKFVVTFNGETVPAADYQYMSEVNMLMFGLFDAKYLTEGELKITIPAGALKIGSTPNTAIEAVWNVVAPKTYDVQLTPADNEDGAPLKEIETVTLFFPEATAGAVFNENGATLRNQSYSYYQTGVISLVAPESRAAESGVSFEIKFPKTTASGMYYLTVRQGTLVLDGAFESPEIEATYVVDINTGIAEIFADENGNVTVYTIDGKLIYDNVPAEEIHNLEKGVIYIINGKKVMLK